MKRREFLVASALTAGSTWVGARKAWSQSPDRAKLDRLAVMSLAFGSLLKSPDYPNDPNRTLDVMEIPSMIAKHFGVHHVEMQHSHFMSTETPYLAEFRDRVKQAGSKMNQINVEFGDALTCSTADPIRRAETIDLTKSWVDHAAFLGCPRVMVNQGSLAPDVRPTAIEALKLMNAYAKTKNVFITMEPRGGGSRPGVLPPGIPAPPPGAPPRPPQPPFNVVVDVIKASGIYCNPDTGNFPDEESRAQGLREMYKLTSGSSHVHYAPERFDEARAIAISKEVGYKGLFSIEAARNNGPDPYTQVQTILDVLVKLV